LPKDNLTGMRVGKWYLINRYPIHPKLNRVFEAKYKNKIWMEWHEHDDELKPVCTWDIEVWVSRDRLLIPIPRKPPLTLGLGLGHCLVLYQSTRGSGTGPIIPMLELDFESWIWNEINTTIFTNTFTWCVAFLMVEPFSSFLCSCTILHFSSNIFLIRKK